MADSGKFLNTDNIIREHSLDLTSIYDDYPYEHMPNKFKLPTTDKGKQTLIETIDQNLYAEAAHMVAFRIPHDKLYPWIKALHLVYYEHYGKSTQYAVSWFDEPDNWSEKTGNKTVCIELSTKTDQPNPLLYKIQLHINTGLIQIQGNHKDTFVTIDFPVLLQIVEKVVAHNLSTSEDKDSTKIKNAKQTLQSDITDTATLDINHNTFVKSPSGTKEISNKNNENQTMEQHEKNVVSQTVDQNNNMEKFMTCMEKHFTNALDKICQQQTDMLVSKMTSMDIAYKHTIQQNEERFTLMMDKVESVINKKANLERENGELKCKIQHINHETTLEKELLKTKMETKCEMLTQKNKSQSDKINKLDLELGEINKEMQVRKNKIESLESSFTAFRKDIEDKEKEILSLKIHASSGDGEFQTVPISRPSKPSVILMGTSNTENIDPRISPDYNVHKVTAYTLDETEKELQKLESEPNVIVLHSLTNELMNKTPNDCVDRMTRICDDIRSRFNNIKIVISLPTPRSDSEDYNSDGQLITILMKTKFRGDDSVILCDNSNLAYKGQVMNRYIAQDQFHLTPDGTAVLAANIRDCIDKALNLPPRSTQGRTGYGRGRPYRGRGGRGGRRGYGRGRRGYR
ncbi:unnamed protein product [Mytilus edulis]|uniref:Uncharacterized protein n=1 Tax=Mytilus edulis TaxID=6550 RepID=A0A8S3V958_MYTED|nr:unnamed protein product [Mytilus edulis]